MKRGRPTTPKRYKRRAAGTGYRKAYTEEDVVEALRLIREEGYSCVQAALVLNSVKVNIVPRMTLNDRLKREEPAKQPKLGRPQELSKAVEQALVKCLVLCAEFQFPMKKKDLQDLVQVKTIKTLPVPVPVACQFRYRSFLQGGEILFPVF